MKTRSLTLTCIATIGAVLLAGNTSAIAQVTNHQEKEEVAVLIKELSDAGYLQVEPSSGAIKVQKSVLEIMKHIGVAETKIHGDLESDGCSETFGGGGDGKKIVTIE